MCSRHAATGSGSSSRVAVITACQRRSTSGSPKTVRAQPSFGYPTIVHWMRRRFSASRSFSTASLGRARCARRWSRSARSSGSASPVIAIVAPRVSTMCSMRATRPRRAPLERVVGSVLDARALQVRVAIVRLDVPGAPLVGDTPDRPDKGQMLRIGRDPEELPGLEVDGDLDRKACIPVEPLVRRHKPRPYSLFPPVLLPDRASCAAW